MKRSRNTSRRKQRQNIIQKILTKPKIVRLLFVAPRRLYERVKSSRRNDAYLRTIRQTVDIARRAERNKVLSRRVLQGALRDQDHELHRRRVCRSRALRRAILFSTGRLGSGAAAALKFLKNSRKHTEDSKIKC